MTQLCVCGNGRQIHCKGKCRPCYEKQHRLDNHEVVRERERRSREKHAERNRRARRLWWRRKHNVTDSDETRTGPCDICKRVRKLCYDHDHETGKHRGWLCFGCNLRLSWFEKFGAQVLKYLGGG